LQVRPVRKFFYLSFERPSLSKVEESNSSTFVKEGEIDKKATVSILETVQVEENN